MVALFSDKPVKTQCVKNATPEFEIARAPAGNARIGALKKIQTIILKRGGGHICDIPVTRCRRCLKS